VADELRIGVIGAGAITQVGHLPVLKRLKGVEVAAICDSDLLKARALAERFQIQDAFDDIDDLLGYEHLDAVVICTPNHLHEAHILAALSANLHVLVEKPLATSLASVQRIIKASEKRSKVLMVGMNHRYRTDSQIVRSFVQNGELGNIESVRGSWHVFRPAGSRFALTRTGLGVPASQNARSRMESPRSSIAPPPDCSRRWRQPSWARLGRKTCQLPRTLSMLPSSPFWTKLRTIWESVR
jgi:predicted dehydrogenase